MAAPCQFLPAPGPTAVLPRVGFKPTRPVNEAGIRIEPPPSLAPATGTTPAATNAAAPPLEPPGEWLVFHGFRVGPCHCGSVIFFKPNSGAAELPILTEPALYKSCTKFDVCGAISFLKS